MQNLLISLAIGVVVALIDVTPMIIKKLDPLFILSAMTMWIVSAILIPRVDLISHTWVNGALVALMILLPVLFLIYRLDKPALPQVLITTLLLGALVGRVSERLLS